MPPKLPAPYFGAKTLIADEVWRRFGDVANYVEPFGGSLAVLLNRPDSHHWWDRIETAGDFSGLVVNFHRAAAADPAAVAAHASWPVTEADLTARHLYLVRYEPALAESLCADPDFFDAQAAGWWVWGLSAWVGGEWCSGLGPFKPGDPDGPGVYRKTPMVHGSHAGRGIHRKLSGAVSAETVSAAALAQIEEQLVALSNRLRRVRLVCGDWERIVASAATPPAGKRTGVFLDPPYDLSERRGNLYGPGDAAADGPGVWERARQWALARGGDEQLRIAYCSYSTSEEDEMFRRVGWSEHRWTAQGGYGLQAGNAARDNRKREVIWFSPGCLAQTEGDGTLFAWDG